MKTTVKKTWLYVLTIASALLPLLFFAVYLPAVIDPAGHNPNIERLPEGEAVDAFIHTNEADIAVVFAAVALGILLLFILDLFLRKKSSHILLIIVATLGVIAYCIVRAIYMIMVGSLSTFAGILYLIAALCFGFMVYLYPKKTLDGDATLIFYVFLIAALFFLFIANATRSSYSLLNALGNGNNPVYWMGYLSSRSIFLIAVVCWYANHLCALEVEEKKESK